jgi:hypothetical protein
LDKLIQFLTTVSSKFQENSRSEGEKNRII